MIMASFGPHSAISGHDPIMEQPERRALLSFLAFGYYRPNGPSNRYQGTPGSAPALMAADDRGK